MAAKITHCIFVSKVNRCICSYFILNSEQHCSGLAGIFLIAVCLTTRSKQGNVFFFIDKELHELPNSPVYVQLLLRNLVHMMLDDAF